MRAREIDPELHTKKDCGRLEFPLSDWQGHRLGLDLEVSEARLAGLPNRRWYRSVKRRGRGREGARLPAQGL